MNKSSFLFLATLIISLVGILSMVSVSYGQLFSNQNQFPPENSIFIFAQTSIYNTEGKIVTYFTTDRFNILDLSGFITLIDKEATENDPIVTIDKKKYQVITRKITEFQDETKVIASNVLADNTENSTILVAQFTHDGYKILEGEKAITIWTFIRPMS